MSKLTLEDFIDRSNNKHNFKYDYSVVKFNNLRSKVKIICPDHGEFEQEADIHLRGAGCPQCTRYGFKQNEPAILYYFLDKLTGWYKIGISNIGVFQRFPRSRHQKRIKLLATGFFQNGSEALVREKLLHKKFKKYRIFNDSWKLNKKNLNGATEFFKEDVLKKDNLSLPKETTCALSEKN